jgi:hypothetical protein
MGAYSLNFYGISISKHYSKIARHVADTLVKTGADSEYLDATYPEETFFELGEYLEAEKVGGSHYDGGGWGQIAYIGQEIRSGKRGIVVSDDTVAEVEGIVQNLPELLANAMKAVMGDIPEPEFQTEEGWG